MQPRLSPHRSKTLNKAGYIPEPFLRDPAPEKDLEAQLKDEYKPTGLSIIVMNCVGACCWLLEFWIMYVVWCWIEELRAQI
ncbi:uncharacterized protein H6S33_008502 [Morchella sextelata]|uniref:uncharacterized protein n=1 Tax=Morchella sextelata TaxID=1174677 RepID=UPI001D059C36|nr:uncharacterized protein H6S33_008502 [Morchella sextelata]KAH0602852.1 hypothetical protein H6S33_008502 [Morchella sextelata]